MTTDTPWTNDQLRREHEAREAFEEARLHEKCSDTIATLERELAECRAALRELVACKDLKERIDAGGSEQDGTLAMDGSNYRRRKPLAWSAARAILAKGEGK